MIKYVKRTEIMAFLNKTPQANDKSWALFGQGVSDSSVNYEANESKEQYIIDEAATTIVESYALSIPTEQKCMVGDDVYDFVNDIRFNLKTGSDAETDVLLVDKYNVVNNNKFKAQVFKASIAISGDYGGKGGETPKINYKVNLNGTPINGTVTISGGVPTFTPDQISG